MDSLIVIHSCLRQVIATMPKKCKPKNAIEIKAFKDYLLIQKRTSVNQRKTYTRYVDNFLTWAKKLPKNITINDIENYQRYLLEYVSPTTHKKYTKKTLSIIHSALNKYICYLVDKRGNTHLIKNSRLYQIPIAKVTSPVKDALTPEEIQRIFKASEIREPRIEDWKHYRNIALMRTLYYAMPRISELISMNIEDINFEKGSIKIYDVKNDVWEEVYPSPHCLQAIREYLRYRKDIVNPKEPENEALWLNFYGRRIGHTDIRKTILRTVSRAKITKRVYPHLFRHSCCTHLAEKGYNEFQIMSLSRHKNLETLKTYVDMAKIKKQKVGHSLSVGIEDDTPIKDTSEPELSKRKIPENDISVASTHSTEKSGTMHSQRVDKTSKNDDLIALLRDGLITTEQFRTLINGKSTGVTDYIQ